MSELSRKRCVPSRKGMPLLGADDAARLLAYVPGWSLSGDGDRIERTFRFEDYYRTIAFVNALAHVAHREDHHPDLEVGYNRCRVVYTTHAAGGITENDFICAAKIDLLAD